MTRFQDGNEPRCAGTADGTALLVGPAGAKPNGGLLLVCVASLLLALAGCRKPSPAAVYQSMVDRQQRFFLEDQKYGLIDEVESLRAQLESCRRENEALKKAVAEGGDSRDYSGGAIGLPPGIDKPARPLDTPPRVEGIPDLTPPKIEIDEGIEIDPGEMPDLNESGSSPGGAAGPRLASHIVAQDERDDEQPQDIVAIWLNPLLTGGYDEDRHGGDDGVLVMFQPRNENKKLVVMPGDVDVALLDPAFAGGPRAVVARWSFDSAEISEHFYKSIWGRGVRLKLPWPNQPPEHRRLRLFVRYRAPDGKQHVAQRDIDIALPGDPPEKLWRAPKGKPPAPPIPAAGNEAVPAEPAEISEPERSAPVIRAEPPLAILEPDEEAPLVARRPDVPSAKAAPIPVVDSPARAPQEDPPPSRHRRPEWKPYR